MAEWTIDIQARDGSSTLQTAAPFKSARVTWSLDGDGSFEVTLRPTDIVGTSWLTGRRRAIFKQSGVAKFTGFHTNLSRAGAPKALTYGVSGLGISAAIGGRIVHDPYYLSDDAVALAWSLIENMQAQTDGDEGFTLGTAVGSAPVRNRYYCEGDKIDDAIAELAAFKVDGFDWEIDGDGAFNVWVGGRGTDLSGTTTLAEADTNDWLPTEETSDLLTYVTGFGQSGAQPCDQIWRVRSSGLAATYGRREDVVSLDKTSDTDDLDDAADEVLRQRGSARRRLNVTWIEGRGPWDFGDVWLGDTVSVELESIFGGTQDMRLITVTATFEPGVHVFTQHEFEAV